MLKQKLSLLVARIDEIIARVSVSIVDEKDSLIALEFHSLFRDKAQISQNLIDPQQRITVDILEGVMRYFMSHGYQFISPIDLGNGLHEGKKIMLTFDDGYYNNVLAVPLLQKYQVPAVFFISTNHVKEGKVFWWDVLYREGKKRVWSEIDLVSTRNNLKNKHFREIEQYLKQTFGENALIPTEDVDRPFTPRELLEFSKQPYVHIGNHTKDHAILTLYSADEIRRQIMGAQSYLLNVIGYKPKIIAYPNGDYSYEVIKQARKGGIQIGFSVDLHKDHLPIDLNYFGIMHLGRFIVRGNKRISSQCAIFRYDNNISIRRSLKKIIR